jgi:hypothetical protein
VLLIASAGWILFGFHPMDNKSLAVLVTVAFSLVGVLGDYFLKLAAPA